GALIVNGSQPGSTVTVNANATLGGSGVVGPITVNAGGTLSPGSSPGILSSGNVALSSGSTFKVELNGASPGSGYDQLAVTGMVNLGGSTLALSFGFTSSVGTAFTIINNDGTDAISGTFSNMQEGSALLTTGRHEF